MTKQEFLEMMRLALNGKVSSGAVMENLRYYEDYINMEVRKGKKEEEDHSGMQSKNGKGQNRECEIFSVNSGLL